MTSPMTIPKVEATSGSVGHDTKPKSSFNATKMFLPSFCLAILISSTSSALPAKASLGSSLSEAASVASVVPISPVTLTFLIASSSMSVLASSKSPFTAACGANTGSGASMPSAGMGSLGPRPSWILRMRSLAATKSSLVTPAAVGFFSAKSRARPRRSPALDQTDSGCAEANASNSGVRRPASTAEATQSAAAATSAKGSVLLRGPRARRMARRRAEATRGTMQSSSATPTLPKAHWPVRKPPPAGGHPADMLLEP
mmetsp:Transcript_119183/g.379941  ORF Transcript_119183/g.379941 Transcript_119183/m.379941 type:complete len:257 (-) Transcript_119183:17-787(-)